ncbi:MAG: thioredoxin domain-containing protein [Patescibacteria group bacterium]
MDKKILTISIVAFVGFILISYFAFNKPTQTYYPDQVVDVEKTASDSAKTSTTDHKKGSGKNILIEYSDLQCPACKMFHDYIEAEKKKDKDFAKLMDQDYTLIYRHFPLVQLHKNAESAAYAAEAAAVQGKYYEFIDRAFTTQNDWAESDKPMDFFVKIAKDLGLDEKKFAEDAKSDAVKKKVQSDTDMATKGEVNATPTFFANGVKLGGYNSFDDFKKMLVDATKNPPKTQK